MYAYFVPILMLFLILFLLRVAEQNAIVKLLKRRRSGEGTLMKEMAQRFVGKNCAIYTFNNQFIGVIAEVTDGALLITTKRGEEAVNLDFVVRIQEYPQKKRERVAKEAE